MKIDFYDMEDQVWVRDQTARILQRHTASGKHFRLELEALLLRVWRLRNSIPAEVAQAA